MNAISYGLGAFVQIYYITPFVVSRFGTVVPLVRGFSPEFQLAFYNALFLAGGMTLYTNMIKNAQASTN